MMKNIIQFVTNNAKVRIIIIGDIILDEYIFVQPKGRAVKDPILSVEYQYSEKYAGGVLAVSNHVSDFVNTARLITLIGDKDNEINFVKKALHQKIELSYLKKKDTYTTLKRRYIDFYRNNKLFKIEYINDKPIEKYLTEQYITNLHVNLLKSDLVLVADFGHGFLNQEIMEVIQDKAKFLCLNVQSNSANLGYNYVTQYKRADYICMNEQEIRLPLHMRFEPIEEVILEFHKRFKFDRFLVTLGKQGVKYFSNGKIYSSPAIITKSVDTVGAGDAVFAITSLFVYAEAPDEMIPFIANCAGAIKSQIMGNKEYITKEKLLKFIEENQDAMAKVQVTDHPAS
jgi:rfaE bifunctional protein kinase chain/domain